jgi:hypothetical protein
VGTSWGGHNTYIALHNRSPVEISCADYLGRRPEAAWLRLTGCFPDFGHLAVESSTRTTSSGQSSTTTAVYVPLRAARAGRREPATPVEVPASIRRSTSRCERRFASGSASWVMTTGDACGSAPSR